MRPGHASSTPLSDFDLFSPSNKMTVVTIESSLESLGRGGGGGCMGSDDSSEGSDYCAQSSSPNSSSSSSSFTSSS